MTFKIAILLFAGIFVGQGMFAQGDTVFNRLNSKGERTGLWKTYKQPLQGEKYFYEIATFENGRYNGLVIHFSPNGTKIEESYYRNDTLDGLSKIYSDDGILRTEQYFKNGQNHGAYRYYSFTGALEEEQEYVEGVHRTAGSFEPMAG